MSKPNLLFIMTDQQRFDALGANGNDVIQTPHLDRLAREGVNVQTYYTNAPVCVVSRCCLFTGRYPHAHQVRENHNLLECGREIHLFRVLKQAGYKLGYVGKNHLLEKAELDNFDHVDTNDMIKDEPEQKRLSDWYAQYKADRAAAGKPELWGHGVFHDFPPECTNTFRCSNSAIDFLNQQDGNDPFALCLSFTDPHVPHLALAKYKDYYSSDNLKLYPQRKGELDEKAKRFGIKYRAQKSDHASEEDYYHYMAVYYAMITWIDENIGRVREALGQNGFADNTLIVFTTDHGEFCFEHGMYKKDLVLLESLLHVPLLVHFPNKLKPRVMNESFMEEVDVMPTILDLLDIDVPFGVQGRSAVDSLRSKNEQHKDQVYGEICPPWLYNKYESYESFEEDHGGWEKTPYNVPGDYNKCIRDRCFRYIWYGTGEEELYDLEKDPDEQYNVADDPAYAAEKLSLKMQLLEWHALSEDPLDPISIRQLQAAYDNWQHAQQLPGNMHGPGWLEERFTPNPQEI